MLFRGLFTLLLAVLGAGLLNVALAPSNSAPDGAGMEQTTSANAEVLIMHHLDSFSDRDLEAILSDYADDAVIITPDQQAAGPDEIRALFEDVLAYGNQDEAPFEYTKVHITGPIGYVLWEWTQKDGSVLSGSDTFLIHNGKIKKHTVAFFVTEKPEELHEDDGSEMMDMMDSVEETSDSTSDSES